MDRMFEEDPDDEQDAQPEERQIGNRDVAYPKRQAATRET